MKTLRWCLALSLMATLLACGQKGPLVLPDQQKPKRSIPTAPAIPQRPAKPPNAPAPSDTGGATASPPPASPSTPPAP